MLDDPGDLDSIAQASEATSRAWIPTTSVAALLVMAGCGVPAPTVVAPAIRGQTRIVHYDFSSQTSEDGRSAPPPPCRALVLREQVLQASDGRERQLAVEIVGGSGDCNEGTRLVISAPRPPSRALAIHAEGPLGDQVRHRIEDLHRRLGSVNGAFSFALGELPWTSRATPITAGGAAYLDLVFARSSAVQTQDRRAHSVLEMKARVRASDRAVACATATLDNDGNNFESNWREHDSERIDLDYGAGPLPCP